MFVETMVKACERVQNETGQRILNNARTEDKYVKKSTSMHGPPTLKTVRDMRIKAGGVAVKR